MPDTLTITDNRTGRSYEVPIIYGTYPEYGAAIPAKELRKIKQSDSDFGMLAYDPGFTTTASCRSAITFIDGENGILRYRGYPIEQLAQNSSYLESSYLTMCGELPSPEELDKWIWDITHHTYLHESMKRLMEVFRYDAHPMGIFVSMVAALSTFYPEASDIHDPENRMKWRKCMPIFPTRWRTAWPNCTVWAWVRSMPLIWHWRRPLRAKYC